VTDEATGRKRFLEIIESENTINGRFTDIKRLTQIGGNGYFSLLLTGTDRETKQRIALKFFDPTKLSQVDRLKRFDREIEMLRYFDDEEYVLGLVAGPCELNRTIVDKTTGIQIPMPFKFCVTELASGSVADLIYSNNFDPNMSVFTFKEMIKAMFRVHRKKVCHRDLKPDNFLIVSDSVRLSDFGTAKNIDGKGEDISDWYRYPVGDLHYSAPETYCSVGIADDFVFLSDCFSMGAILFEMFTQTALTGEIYDQRAFEELSTIHQILSRMKKDNRIKVYIEYAPNLAKRIRLPDIYS